MEKPKIEFIPVRPEHNYVLNLAKPVPANQFLPEWYKKLKHHPVDPTDLNLKDNAKGCPAIQDILTTGYIIPAWSWINIVQEHAGPRVQHGVDSFFPQHELIGGHMPYQVEGVPVEQLASGGILKLHSPWRIYTSKGWGVLYSDPFWTEDRRIRLLPGLVRSDVYGSVNFPFEINPPLEVGESVQILQGDPLIHVQVVPLDEETELIIRKSTEEDEAKHFEEGATVLSVHKNSLRKVHKEYDKNN